MMKRFYDFGLRVSPGAKCGRLSVALAILLLAATGAQAASPCGQGLDERYKEGL